METALFKQLGLTEGEIKTYLALLRIGSSSTGPLAKASGVSRSKLYGILDKLEKKGIASHVDQDGVLKYQAAEPAKITDLITQKEQELKALENKFQEFLPTLEAYQNEHATTQKVSLYQGLKGLQTAHEHIYQKLSKGDEFYYLGIPPEQPMTHHLYWQRDHMRRIKAGINCKLLFNKNTSDEILKNRNSYKGCDARRMSSNILTPAYFLIYADTVMIAVPSAVPVIVEIVSEEIAQAFKQYFEEFWKQAKSFT